MPSWNLVTKPSELSFEQAACLPTAWLTAYRMLFTRGRPAAWLDRSGAGCRGRGRDSVDCARSVCGDPHLGDRSVRGKACSRG